MASTRLKPSETYISADWVTIYLHFKPTGNERSFTADIGFKPPTLRLMWRKYGKSLRKLEVNKLDIMWALSFAKKNDPGASMAADWSTYESTFSTKANRAYKALYIVLDEVRSIR